MAYLNTDIPELSGSDTAICLDNLELLGFRLNRITESMLATLSELADAILRDAAGDPDTVDSILLSLQGTAEEWLDTDDRRGRQLREEIAAVNRDIIARTFASTGIYMRLILYRFIEERLPARRAVADTTATGPDAARGRIAYMSGALADKAYLRLSTCVPSARAADFHSFVEACEEVRGGLCEYGILPLENNQTGTLTAFSCLIIRYGLCIIAVTDVDNISMGQTTRFALVRKATEEEAEPTPVGAAPHQLELLHLTDTPSLPELLGAAAFCGLKVSRVDTLPRTEELELLPDTAADTPAVLCVFELGERADLATFRRFLSQETPDDLFMGLYGTV